MTAERVHTVVIGGGQAGLAIGYHLSRLGRPFVVLEAHERVGDSWRERWDSLRLFTPARYDALPGRRYPGSQWAFPSREEFADYLESYARELGLPVRTGAKVQRLAREDGAFVVEAGADRFIADNVVVASGFDQVPRIPSFAADLDPTITQLHSAAYRNPTQLPAGDVLVVGAGNSGADIALEVSRTHRTFLSGRHPGQVPWRIETVAARPLDLVVFFAFSHVLTLKTPVGRRLRPKALAHSGPLIRVKAADLEAAGVQRVPRTTRVEAGKPVLEDGRPLEVASVVWCTGYRPDYAWIDLPVLDDDGHPLHDRGISTTQPGLYFLGLVFQYALSSSMIHGVGRDARHTAEHIAHRTAG